MELNLQNLVKAGAHFGHEARRWNPKMRPFIYQERQGIHIIDLQKTLVQANRALDFLRKLTADGGRVIFVGTKLQAQASVEKAAVDCGQFYVTKRWLGGCLTNFQTITVSINRMKAIERMRERFDVDRYSKKELSRIEKEYRRLEGNLKGVKDMKGPPAALFLTDIKRERIALLEARKMNIPVVAVVDTNCDPSLVQYPVPGNDDSARSIECFAALISKACQEGREQWQAKLRESAAADGPSGETAASAASGGTDQQKDGKRRRAGAPRSGPNQGGPPQGAPGGRRRAKQGGGGPGSSRPGAKPGRGGESAKPGGSSGGPNQGGPTVVTLNRASRKLAAAGTADDAEINMEIEMEMSKEKKEKVSGPAAGGKDSQAKEKS